MKNSIAILSILLLVPLAPVHAADVPQSLTELWADYPALEKSTPLEIEVLKECGARGCGVPRCPVSGWRFQRGASRVAAFYAFPKGGTKLPALVQLHGGGQSASLKSVVTYAKRGYAGISLNWGGNAMSLGQETWNGRKPTGANSMQRIRLSAIRLIISPVRSRQDEFTLDKVESPRNSNGSSCSLRRGVPSRFWNNNRSRLDPASVPMVIPWVAS